MSSKQLAAWILIALGALALLSRLGPGTGWLWIALVAAGFLYAYQKQEIYPLLVVGGILAGVSGGILIEGAWGWDGAFLMCLGAGFLIVDRVEPKPSRWPIYPATILLGLGALDWLFNSGVLESLWFPLLLIVAGFLLLRARSRGTWVEVDDSPKPDANAGQGTRTQTYAEPSAPENPEPVEHSEVKEESTANRDPS